MPFIYEYYFVKRGTTRATHTGVNNEIWLDVGGSIREGTFDHHDSEKGYVSTVDVLVHELDLLESTKEKLNPKEKVRIYVHENPDVDALFSCYFLVYFLNHTREEFMGRFITGACADSIIKYVNDIDAGKRKKPEGATLYNLICHMDLQSVKDFWKVANDIELSNRIIEEAFVWIEQAISCLEENPGFNLYDWNLPIAEGDVVAKAISENLAEIEKYNYERDKKEGRLKITELSIWTKDGNIENVKAAIWREVPLSPSSSYLYARQEGAVVTFVPHHEYGKNGARVSINPNIEGAVEKYSLTEVAEMYEQMEQIYDRRHLSESGFLRRDYSKPRGDGKSSIFLEKPFAVTAEPWYVSETGDMVDAPRAGSLIPIEVMIEILENITKMVKKTYLVNFELDITGGNVPSEVSVDKGMNESLLTWSKRMKQTLSTTNNDVYPLVITEIDSSLISHHYDILDAYFMNISDGAYMEAEGKNVLRLDYRTHLYVNQANAVLFIATSDQTCNHIQMNGMLDWSSVNTLKESTIVHVFSKILYQREKFKELGRFLKDFKENTRKIKRKNEELIVLLANAQADECIDTQVELDVFEFVYDALDITKLRESVKDTMSMVSEYAKERVYANLNFLSLITIPFILLSTLFQVGMIKFKPLIDLELGDSTIPVGLPWLISLLIVVVITLFLFFARRKK